MIVSLQYLTLKCIARVFFLKSSLEKLLNNFVGNVGLYSVGKRMRKNTLKSSGSEFRGSLATWPKS